MSASLAGALSRTASSLSDVQAHDPTTPRRVSGSAEQPAHTIQHLLRVRIATTQLPELPPHHLYLVVENNKAHLDHVLLRDLLRADARARDRYAELKRANVLLAQGDIDVYVAAKAQFVADLLTRARAERGLEPAIYWIPDMPGVPQT